MVNGELQIPSSLIKMETSGFYLNRDSPSPTEPAVPLPSPQRTKQSLRAVAPAKSTVVTVGDLKTIGQSNSQRQSDVGH